MKKLICLLVCLLIAIPAYAAEWVLITMPELPFYDQYGNILDSVEGRKNRYGEDAFWGSGYVWPNIDDKFITETYQNGNLLILNLNVAIDKLAETIKDRTMITTYAVVIDGRKRVVTAKKSKGYTYVWQSLTEMDAIDMYKSWGYNIAESGVT